MATWVSVKGKTKLARIVGMVGKLRLLVQNKTKSSGDLYLT